VQANESRRWSPESFLIAWVLTACGPEPILPTDSGQPTGDDTAGDTGDEGPDYFVPVLWQIQEVMYLWEDGAFSDYRLESGGEPIASSMTIRFMTQEYLESGAEEGRCDWSTDLVLDEETTRGDPAVWTGMNLHAVTSETDCSNFDPEEWEGGDPIEHLETTALWFGVGPNQAFAAVLESLYENAGMSWVQDGEPYVFSLFFGLWSEDDWGLLPSEINYAVAYEVDFEGAIQYDGNGDAKLVELGEGVPDGVIRALPYHSQVMGTLPP